MASRSATCTAQQHELSCQDENDSFILRRAGERAVQVRDINARKHIDPNENFLGKFLRADLGDDDRIFRLEEQNDASCDIPR